MLQILASGKWGLPTKWVLATTVGWGVCQSGYPGQLLGGALLGVLQWLVLRRIIVQPWWWVLATALAMPVASAASMIFGMAATPIYSGQGNIIMSVLGVPGMGAAFGAILGTAQWLVLQKNVPNAGWWILANAGGLALYWVIEQMSKEITGFPGSISLYLLGFTIATLIFSLVTGWTLVRLLPKNGTPP